MHIICLRLKNFQSFGSDPTRIELTKILFVLGPNGAGKTAVLVALARLFSPLKSLRRVQVEDFHLPADGDGDGGPPTVQRELWLEVDIEFEETADDGGEHPSVPPFFKQMALEDAGQPPRVRIRLTATLDDDGYVDEKIEFITQVDAAGEPKQRSDMSRHDRASIEVHYLPARRDPVEHIGYAAASLLGRMLRAADWTKERQDLARLTDKISTSMGGNAAVLSIGIAVSGTWAGLHSGAYFKDPAVAFGRGDIEGVLRQLTVNFAPGPAGGTVSFDRLSDGQKSLLYISLVLAWQEISRKALKGEGTAFDPIKLRPPVYIVLALEEPENSLAPRYLGRIIRQIRDGCAKDDAQGLIATHAPTLLNRVPPEDIRFLRLSADCTTSVRSIVMPPSTDEAAKYVREAVLAYPELYFARLVVLGEGDSEQVVLPRVLAAAGIAEDDASVCVVPLGGRHVNHFWRLLERLDIPYVTLLDLDCGRYQAGWGRVSYAANQINAVRPGTFIAEHVQNIPKWNAKVDFPSYEVGNGALHTLAQHGVFFSSPLDLDLMLLEAYPDAYGVRRERPDDDTKKAVLGKSMANADRIDPAHLDLFGEYHRQFKLGSKPANHLRALAELKDEKLMGGLPSPLGRLIDAVQGKLENLPE